MSNNHGSGLAAALLAAATLLPLAAHAHPEEDGAAIRRYPLDSPFPIAKAVEIPAGKTLIFVSGMTPEPADAKAKEFSAAYWGDTEAQTHSVLKRIEAALQGMGLGMGDVVKMQAFVVAPEGKTAMDFEGFMKGYTQFFGPEAQKLLPARTTVQIAGLARPGMLVEIDVIVARP
jgi:enamine deaminase RidA (YjgF/YER057c/UK114 family)